MVRRFARARVVIAWLLALAGGAAADPRPITLGEVIAAVPRAPAAAVSPHEVAAAEALVAAAGAWPNPSVHVSTNRLTARLVAGATVPLPVFGTVGAARRQAAAEADVVRAEGAAALRLLRHRVVLAWIALARLDGDVVASSIAAQQAAELGLIARGRQEAGVGADVDVTTASAAKARADVAAAAAVRAQAAGSAELAGVLGWPLDLPLRSAGPVDTGAPAELARLRARLARHPERIAAAARIAAADATAAQVSSLAWPSLALEAEVSYDDPTNADRTDALIGVAIELPVFARIGDRVRAARATEAAARARLAVTDAELGAELAAAFERWQAAVATLGALEHEVVPAQERAAALSAQAYREGARDLASALNAARADAAVAWEYLQLAAGTDDN